MNNFDGWEGKSWEQQDTIDGGLVAGMIATLDRNDSPPKNGDLLPPCWHWMYFRDNTRQSQLGIDGHGARGGNMPAIPLPRRMWAGSNIKFLHSLRIGETALKRTLIKNITSKIGNSGHLIFVNLQHTILNSAEEKVIEEEQSLVYREAPKSSSDNKTNSTISSQATWTRKINPDPVLLFRYSALTFNPHRIHYDRKYSNEEEGYPGLVVHGPLIATLMVDLCRRNCPDKVISEFSFRALAPLFDVAPMILGGEFHSEKQTVDVWAASKEGGLASQGTVKFIT